LSKSEEINEFKVFENTCNILSVKESSKIRAASKCAIIKIIFYNCIPTAVVFEELIVQRNTS